MWPGTVSYRENTVRYQQNRSRWWKRSLFQVVQELFLRVGTKKEHKIHTLKELGFFFTDEKGVHSNSRHIWTSKRLMGPTVEVRREELISHGRGRVRDEKSLRTDTFRLRVCLLTTTKYSAIIDYLRLKCPTWSLSPSSNLKSDNLTHTARTEERF